MKRIILALALLPSVAWAQHRHPNATYFGATAKFYETWMKPDDPQSSCCSLTDCAPVSQVRQINGKWEALPEGSNVWLSIPAAKVEQNRDSPDGRSHLCRIGSTVLCFIAGAGG
jgi:hypothetical protein